MNNERLDAQIPLKTGDNQEKTLAQRVEDGNRKTGHELLQPLDEVKLLGDKDDTLYKIKEITGDEAIVHVPEGDMPEKTVKLKNLYDAKKSPAQRGAEAAYRLTDHESLKTYDKVKILGDDDTLYEIEKIDGDEAIIWAYEKNESEKEKAYKTVKTTDLYDPMAGRKLSKKIDEEDEEN